MERSEQIDRSQVGDVVENDLQPDVKDDMPSLHAMQFGELLDTAFSLYRRHFRSLFGVTSVYCFCIAMLIAISIFLLGHSVERRSIVGIYMPTIAVFLGVSVFLLSGLVVASAEAYLGRRVRIGAALRQGGRRFLRCFAGSLLFGLLAILLIFFSALLFVAIPTAFLDGVPYLVGLLFIGCIVVFVTNWFVSYWCFFIASVLVEEKSVLGGLGRSHELIRGTWWRVVGMMFAILLLNLVLGFIVRIAVGVLMSLTGFMGVMKFLETAQWTVLLLLLPTQPDASSSDVLIYFINLGIDTFTTPIWVIGSTLLYFNQRIRKEGFDIEMMATRQGA